MELEGQIEEVGLSDVFRLLKMSARTGVLKVSWGRHAGGVYFRDGRINYAHSTLSGAPLGERLVKAGELHQGALNAALAEQRQAEEPRLLGAMLREKGLVSQEALEQYVREQIEDAVFNLFSLTEGRFEFLLGGVSPVDDIVVSLDADAVVMESCRRVDEWTLAMPHVGSLEKVPYLTANAAATVSLSRREWELICFIDGRRDVNTIVADSGFDRFRTVKTLYGLLNAGAVATRDPTLELLGQTVAIALKGPIDVYNLTFLTTVSTSDVSAHLRIENVDDEPMEVRISAGVRDADVGSALVYVCESRTPASIIKRMALETSGYVVLVNINSRDAVVASRPDIALMAEIGDRPYVVAAYASLADEIVSTDQVRQLLELPDRVPVLVTGLREPDETAAVIVALTELIP
jgi:Domain of unknown function (DUF4388)